jgi:hypothetical protein
MTKRARSDSVSSAVRAAVGAANGPPKPLACTNLRPGDMAFWDAVVRARAYDDWQPVDLVVAAQLARCQADIEVEQTELAVEGTVIVNDRGTKVVNPRVSVLEQFARREMALLRSLRMGGKPAGDSADLVKGAKLQRSADQTRAELLEDDLLAR